MNIGNAITALRAGWVLKHPATWKSRQQAVNALAGLLTVAAAVAKGFGYALPDLPDDVLGAVAGGVWGCVCVFNLWGTAATTDKIGLLPARRPPDAADGPGPGVDRSNP